MDVRLYIYMIIYIYIYNIKCVLIDNLVTWHRQLESLRFVIASWTLDEFKLNDLF